MDHLLLLALAGAVLLLVLWRSYAKWKDRRRRDFLRRLETVMQPKEEVLSLCPGKKGRWIVTNKRLLMEDGDGFFAIPFSKIKKLQGQDGTGKITTAPAKMKDLTINGTYTLDGKNRAFPDFAKELKAQVKRYKDSQKAK